MDRARKLGLAGKQNYRTQPGAMLVARATAECARLIASDALLGLGYAAEEIDDDLIGVETSASPPAAPADTTPGGEAGPRKRTARRKSAQPAAVARPPVPPASAGPEPEPDFDEPEPEVEAISKAQLSKLHIQLDELGVTDRDEGLALYDTVIGHPVASSKDLTKAEASLVVEELDRRLLAKQKADAEQAQTEGGDPS